MTEKLSDIVIGQGIAAHAFLWTYAQMIKEGRLDRARRVIWIKSPVFPTCSLTSTSLISRAGLHRGVSPHGDHLIAGFELFQKYFQNFSGVEVATQKHLPHGDIDNFNKRFGDAPEACLLASSRVFLSSLEQTFKSILKDSLIELSDTLVEYSEHEITLHSGKKLNFNQCYLALGAANSLLGFTDKTRAVSGQYAHAKADLGESAWILSKGPHNLIYRAQDKTLLLGSLDDKEDELGWPNLAPRTNDLKSILENFEVDLPKGLDWKIEVGVRHKGHKRLPFWGRVAGEVYSIHGLYKNGYTLAFLAAKELLR